MLDCRCSLELLLLLSVSRAVEMEVQVVMKNVGVVKKNVWCGVVVNATVW